MRQRVLIALSLIPPGVFVIWAGGWVFFIGWTLVLFFATLEYTRLTQVVQMPAPAWLTAGSVLAICTATFLLGYPYITLTLGIVTVITTAWFLFEYEKGSTATFGGWGTTLAGIFYIGLSGALLIAIRNLPGGFWWVLVVLPANWMADSCALFFGKAFGKHRMAPKLSPKKSWEGYLAGIVGTTLIAPLWAWLWNTLSPQIPFLPPTPPEHTLFHLTSLAFLLAIFGTVGDLGISMLKRSAKVKDTGHILAEHGGILDRIDSWLTGAVVGLLYLLLFVYPAAH
jgi:phosphatidate cytidylyltransferase